MKSHVNGLKCNICGKVLKNRSSLRKHLARHGPQVSLTPGHRAGPQGHSARPPDHRAEPPSLLNKPLAELTCSVCNKRMKHKHNLQRHMKIHKNSFQLKASKWETLK